MSPKHSRSMISRLRAATSLSISARASADGAGGLPSGAMSLRIASRVMPCVIAPACRRARRVASVGGLPPDEQLEEVRACARRRRRCGASGGARMRLDLDRLEAGGHLGEPLDVGVAAATDRGSATAPRARPWSASARAPSPRAGSTRSSGAARTGSRAMRSTIESDCSSARKQRPAVQRHRRGAVVHRRERGVAGRRDGVGVLEDDRQLVLGGERALEERQHLGRLLGAAPAPRARRA